MGSLRGIQITPALRAVIKAVLALPQQVQAETSLLETKGEGTSATLISTTPVSSSPSESLARAAKAKEQLSSLMTVKEASSILQSALNNAAVDAALPLSGILALQSLIQSSQTDTKTKTQQSQDLEAALHQTKQLSFQKSSTSTSNSKQSTDPKFQKRLERLRLQDEERSYLNLTTNLKTAASLKDDNVTVKSMTYAASVGLNMILDSSVRKKSKRRENRSNPFGYTQKSMERVYSDVCVIFFISLGLRVSHSSILVSNVNYFLHINIIIQLSS
ncbi:hypothetical protein ACHAXM_004396 [Skeletonema potamos]